jgi:hypothetical protein
VVTCHDPPFQTTSIHRSAVTRARVRCNFGVLTEAAVSNLSKEDIVQPQPRHSTATRTAKQERPSDTATPDSRPSPALSDWKEEVRRGAGTICSRHHGETDRYQQRSRYRQLRPRKHEADNTTPVAAISDSQSQQPTPGSPSLHIGDRTRLHRPLPPRGRLLAGVARTES